MQYPYQYTSIYRTCAFRSTDSKWKMSSSSERQNSDNFVDDARERFCSEYALNDCDELDQLAKATRLSLQLADASAESPSTSPAKEPLLSLRSQNGLEAQLRDGGTSEPLPVNWKGSNKTRTNGQSVSRSSSGSLSENDLDVPATVPKPRPGGYSDDASASAEGPGPADLIAQCSACERPLKSHRHVCLFDHGNGKTEQYFCKRCIQTCPLEHVQLLVRNQRPLTSGERERFNLLRSNNGM